MKRILSVILSLVIILSLAAPVDAAQKPKLNKKKATLTISETVKNPTITLKVKGTKKKAKWSTSNKKVATVKNGKVTAKREGRATITCKVNGKKLTCKVTVSKCKHKWKKHWCVYENAQINPHGYANRKLCGCGSHTLDIDTDSHYWSHDDKYPYIQSMIGLHGVWAKVSNTSTIINQPDETHKMTAYWLDKVRTEYIDYVDCTKCGDHVDALDLPNKETGKINAVDGYPKVNGYPL